MKIPKKYWQIAKRLSTAQLQREDDDSDIINEADLFNIDIGKRGRNCFLGYYSLEGLKLVFEKYGVIDDLKKIGFNKIIYDLDTADPYLHRLTLYNQHKTPRDMLVEIVLKKQSIIIDMPFENALNGKSFETLAIEWMGMQNPYSQFTRKRPQLPGQKYPGLGLASKAVELLMIMCWRLNLAGLINTPDHYHNAYVYSRIFFYLNPLYQARLSALVRDLKKYPLDMIAWAIEWGAVYDQVQNKPLEWFVGKQIVPFNEQLKKLFNSKEYKQYVKENMSKLKYTLDKEKYYNIVKERKTR